MSEHGELCKPAVQQSYTMKSEVAFKIPTYPMVYRQMVQKDLMRMNSVNLDVFTENFNTAFYLNYLVTWPELNVVAEMEGTRSIAGYIIGKVEGCGKDWHGHVTALSVAPGCRQLGIATYLMQMLHATSEKYGCYYVDLFVKANNKTAMRFYERLGYKPYRLIKRYYSTTGEDAYDMRKPLSRDSKLECLASASC